MNKLAGSVAEDSMVGSSRDSSPNERSLQDSALKDLSLKDLSLKDLSLKDLSLKDLSLKDLAFEDALAELETIVQQLEQGSSRLEESIAIYERGEALKAHCEQLLNRAQVQVEKITRVVAQEKSDASASNAPASKSSDDDGKNKDENKDENNGEDGEKSFARAEMAVSNGDLVSSLARRG